MILFSKCNLIFICTLVITLLPFGLLELYYDEVQSLSELPMDKLLKIRSSFGEIDDEYLEEEEEENGLEGRTVPLAYKLPQKKIGNKLRRHGGWDEKGEESKISKIFQFSLTTLSFLAFGGYLLTLIITSLKRNSGTPGNVIVLSNLQKFTRPKRDVFGIDPMENDFNNDKFYRGMIMLSEEFAFYSKPKHY
ncbi:uncharacterized protein LOC141536199 [Cotesia typhae]|uniref:uncharacterized protein LOC141536199 n=1 Tax=Cotesia typhae TaxID=2053667 RepID=UPI003D6945E1